MASHMGDREVPYEDPAEHLRVPSAVARTRAPWWETTSVRACWWA